MVAKIFCNYLGNLLTSYEFNDNNKYGTYVPKTNWKRSFSK
jgi:hypothetical protein